jgi:rod shape-determining protein MreC
VEFRNRELGEEVLRLREENVLLRNGLAGLQDREAAAAVLRDAGRAFFFARVIGLDAANEHMSAVIDKGSRHGLKADLPVLDTRGRLVGRIIAPIEPGTATVQLVTDGDIAVGVYGEAKRVLGILSGDSRNGLCRLKYVLASNEDLAVGEALFTSGQDRIFPRGILVGEVTAIAVDGSLFKRITVRPSLDLRQLAIVAVLTGPVGE